MSSDEEIQELIATERSNWIKFSAIAESLKHITQEIEKLILESTSEIKVLLHRMDEQGVPDAFDQSILRVLENSPDGGKNHDLKTLFRLRDSYIAARRRLNRKGQISVVRVGSHLVLKPLKNK